MRFVYRYGTFLILSFTFVLPPILVYILHLHSRGHQDKRILPPYLGRTFEGKRRSNYKDVADWETLIREEQSFRQSRKRRWCRSREPWPDLDPRDIETLMVDLRHEVAFCAVAKTASTSWTTKLLSLVGRSDIMSFDHMDFIQSNSSDLTYINNFQLAQSKRILQKYFTFLFVREPWERLLSAFKSVVGDCSKKVFYSRFAPQLLKHLPTRLAYDKITFAEFLDFIANISSSIENADKHWRPIYLWCHVCQVNYTFMGHLEESPAESYYLLLHAFQQPWFDELPFTNYNMKARTSRILRQAYKYVPDKTIHQIREIYRPDFEMFGYSTESPKG